LELVAAAAPVATAAFFATGAEVMLGPMTLAEPLAASSRDFSLMAFCFCTSFARIETRSSGIGLLS
jgi:hypothetical protein